MKIYKTLLPTLLMLILVWGCTGNNKTDTAVRGMYYWNTTFSMDSVKLAFMYNHKVDKIYMRMFDVVVNKDGVAVPNATISLGDTVADCPVPIVPTIYILNDCFKQPDDSLAPKLLRRVLQMCETHGLKLDGELQIDCDWTGSTRNNLYRFLQQLRDIVHQKGLKLSTTIRLHQLSQPAPPVDSGVLMVYNTGDMTRLDVDKPILNPKDVMPYLKYLHDYKLPLAAAYPIFRWEILFRHGKFVDIIHSPDEIPVLPGDTIVVRQPLADDILKVKREIESRRNDCAEKILLYDLNNYNIKRYSDEQIESFFT